MAAAPRARVSPRAPASRVPVARRITGNPVAEMGRLIWPCDLLNVPHWSRPHGTPLVKSLPGNTRDNGPTLVKCRAVWENLNYNPGSSVHEPHEMKI